MRIAFVLTTLFTLILSSCSTTIKHDRLFTGTVVRDCTGTYIRIDDKEDYLVCNAEMLQEKKEGETVSVIYDFEKTCKELDDKVTCMMYHEHKGKIRIKKNQL
ncbi:hypothetical protein [Empedobacter brevis]|uniref:Lipoprotein n=2 Tax=Empedobacter brevis TaxID=247 RepID=A0A511NL65_9FLAO|nr:hypothetical protein [Empedobacter brevis]GEM53533.1 hypothetical protein EB1_33230 [Empedobacter brevis NBRC 14943 = ATCC 43319]